MLEIRSCLPLKYLLDSVDMYRFRNCYVWHIYQIPKPTLFSRSQAVGRLVLQMLLAFASSLKLCYRSLRKLCLNGCCHYHMMQVPIALLDVSLILYTSDFHLNWNKPYRHRHDAPL